MTGSRPMNSGISLNPEQVLGISFSRMRPLSAGIALVGTAPDRAPTDPLLDDLLPEPVERAAADEQHVRGIDLDEVLVGCLRPPWGGTLAMVLFEDLEERLLDALARHVAGDRRVVRLARDLHDRRCI